MVISEELIGTTEHLTLYARCRIDRCRYNRVLLYITFFDRVDDYKIIMIHLCSNTVVSQVIITITVHH
jgi:hypothetical protein